LIKITNYKTSHKKIRNFLQLTFRAGIGLIYKQEIKDVFVKLYIEFDQPQNVYDEETIHGTDKNVQEKWGRKVRKMYAERTKGKKY
jgi:hypothetical protein